MCGTSFSFASRVTHATCDVPTTLFFEGGIKPIQLYDCAHGEDFFSFFSGGFDELASLLALYPFNMTLGPRTSSLYGSKILFIIRRRMDEDDKNGESFFCLLHTRHTSSLVMQIYIRRNYVRDKGAFVSHISESRAL